MYDYEKLICSLRAHQGCGHSCDECAYYISDEELCTKGFSTCSEYLAKDAADAIEALTKRLEHIENDICEVASRVNDINMRGGIPNHNDYSAIFDSLMVIGV